MSVWWLSSMTWEEVRDLDRSRVLAVLPIGAVEAHGPHLPLATDVILSEAMARTAGERLSDAGHDVVILPALYYTPATWAAGFAGTISINENTLQMLVRDIVENLAGHGVRLVAIANTHLDPAHLSALTSLIDGEHLPVPIVFPNLTRRTVAQRLTEEFQSGACHAGQFETSIVQAERPELVREDLRRALQEHPVSLSTAMRQGAQNFEEAGGDRAYFGFPSQATPAEGAASVDTLGAILADAILETLHAA